MLKYIKDWWNALNQIFYFRVGFTYSDIYVAFKFMTLGFDVLLSIPDIFHNKWIYKILYIKHSENKRAWHDLSFNGTLFTGISIDISKENKDVILGLLGLIYTYHSDTIECDQN